MMLREWPNNYQTNCQRPPVFNFQLNKIPTDATIQLNLLSTPDNDLGNEGYKLSVKPESVSISANKRCRTFLWYANIVCNCCQKKLKVKQQCTNVTWMHSLC